MDKQEHSTQASILGQDRSEWPNHELLPSPRDKSLRQHLQGLDVQRLAGRVRKGRPCLPAKRSIHRTVLRQWVRQNVVPGQKTETAQKPQPAQNRGPQRRKRPLKSNITYLYTTAMTGSTRACTVQCANIEVMSSPNGE